MLVSAKIPMFFQVFQLGQEAIERRKKRRGGGGTGGSKGPESCRYLGRNQRRNYIFLKK